MVVPAYEAGGTASLELPEEVALIKDHLRLPEVIEGAARIFRAPTA